MVDFRKSFLLLALVALVAMSASAQSFSCAARAGAPLSIRGEGLSEEVGNIFIQCTGGTQTANGAAIPTINIQIFMNVNVTSRILATNGTGGTESLLLIDEPGTSEQVFCGAAENGVNNYSAATGSCNVLGTLGGTNPYKAAGVPNIFQGRWNSVQPNVLTWNSVPLDPPGTIAGAIRSIRILNIRVNASERYSLLPVPLDVTALVTFTGTGAPGVSDPLQRVGFVQRSMQFDIISGATGGSVLPTSSLPKGMNFQTCNANNSGVAGTGAGCWDFRFRFTELIANAFRDRPTTANQNNIGTIYNTEHMFASSTWPTLVNGTVGSSIGYATNPTRLTARLSNVPSGVSIYVTNTPTNSDSVDRLASITGVQSGANTGSTSCTSGSVGTATVIPSTYASTGSGRSYTQLLPTATSATGNTFQGTWNVDAHAPGSNQQYEFGVLVVFGAASASLGEATGAGGYAPSYSPSGSNILASSSLPVPRFTNSLSAEVPAFNTIPCRTNLLFPYVTNQLPFDTGIAISNTSVAPSPLGSPNQSGQCTINYYGVTYPGGGAAPAPQTSTNNVAGGSHITFSLSNGGTPGINATPGFQGYIIAQCNFQYGHGFAFITDAGAQRLAMGYLALVMDSPLTRAGVAISETLGN